MTRTAERTVAFLDGPCGPLFHSGYRALGRTPGRAGVLVVPPFGEEMNKSRHVLAAIVRRLGARGADVLLPDLHGTGDSAGDFGDASVDAWRAELDAIVAALLPAGPIDVVGLRFGALLAADLGRRHPLRRLVLAQPVVHGRQQLVQLLRLRIASGMVAGGGGEKLADLVQRLDQGDSLEVAGYRLSPGMARGMRDLELGELRPEGQTRVAWLEVAADAGRPLTPAGQAVVDEWRRHGVGVSTAVVPCDAFWATQEIARCDGLVDSVLAQLVDGDR